MHQGGFAADGFSVLLFNVNKTMGPRRSATDNTTDVGYPGVLYGLCKEEDVLIIPQFVMQLTNRQAETVSPRFKATAHPESLLQIPQKSKESRLNQRLDSVIENESKGEDLIAYSGIPPPQVGIVYSNPEDKDSPVAIICRNFYIEFALITAVGKSLKSYPTISCLKIENCCISKEIAEALALLLADESGKWISDVSLDGNEDIAEVLPLFVKLQNGLRYLSLARCSLEDDDLEPFAEALGYLDGKEHKLQCLNLSMNRIGDAGVAHLAEALRTNRSLISLSLAGNQIGDEGVARLTEVLQKFPLTRDELVMRRKRIFDSIFRKKNAVEKYIEEWKAREEGDVQSRKIPPKSMERMGRKIRGPDGKIRCLSSRDSKHKSLSMKSTSGEKFRGKVRPPSSNTAAAAAVEPTAEEILEILQQVESEMPPDKHPLINEVRLDDNGAFCYGCWSLGNINLAYNYLSQKSLERFLDVLKFQNETYSAKVGLLRLVLLPGNLFQENSPEFQKLLTALIYHGTKKDVPENSDSVIASPARRASSAKPNNNNTTNNKK